MVQLTELHNGTDIGHFHEGKFQLKALVLAHLVVDVAEIGDVKPGK